MVEMSWIQEGKQIVIEFAGVTSIDGITKPGGKFHVMEIEDGEWTGGTYADEDNLSEKVMEFFVDDDD
jgi:hypothetical protein|tara:strand:- start:5 stop:208 length:204 start_codon:yes stop_codon:yes gene_type:complete